LAYSVGYKNSVQRDLRKLPRSEVRRVLDQIEEELSKNAENYPVLKGRFAGLRKYRIGDYRVIYAVLGNDVLILRIGHRKDVYNKKMEAQ
jgi:mRNA interferase RelE/StbE